MAMIVAELHRRRSRRAAPRHGIQALRSPHARNRNPAALRHDRATASPARQQEAIVQSITSFALYGFPESHAASFALIAYASAYLKCRYLAAFTAAILNNQPMGFYAPGNLGKGRPAPRPALQTNRRHTIGLALHHRRRKRRTVRSPGLQLCQRTARTAGPSNPRRARASAIRKHSGSGRPRPRASQRRTAKAERNRRAQFHHRIPYAPPRRALGLRTRHPSHRPTLYRPTPNPQSPAPSRR